MDADIGAPAIPGSASASGNTITVNGGGADIWASFDEFNYDSESLTGDGAMIAHVDSIQNTDSWAKAGLMFRNSSSAGSAHVALFQQPCGAVDFQWRDTNGGYANYIQAGPLGSEKWLMLVKAGNIYTAYYATTLGVPAAADWVLVGSHTTAFTNTAYLGGLAVTAHNDSLLNTTVFSSFSVTNAAAP
jgi:hypothetical protein